MRRREERGEEGGKKGGFDDGEATDFEGGGDGCREMGEVSRVVGENVGEMFGGVGKWAYLCDVKMNHKEADSE